LRVQHDVPRLRIGVAVPDRGKRNPKVDCIPYVPRVHNEGVNRMRAPVVAAVIAVFSALVAAQETKPVPKDSVRVTVPGCTKGYIFTASRRTEDEPITVDIPEGMHIRMNGPKDMMKEIKAHEGAMIEITGLMKKGQFKPGGVAIGGGVRIGPGPSSPGGGIGGSPNVSQIMIDVEGWRSTGRNCPSE
jgi:hypothetical protein